MTTPSGAEELEIAILVSSGWPQAVEIDVTTLRRIYLGQKTQWSGLHVQPVHLAADSRARAVFERIVLGRSPAELERYWIEQALRGGALPPLERGNAETLLRDLREHPGWVGYAARAELPAEGLEGVRVLLVSSAGGPLRPGDVGYPLRGTAGER